MLRRRNTSATGQTLPRGMRPAVQVTGRRGNNPLTGRGFAY